MRGGVRQPNTSRRLRPHFCASISGFMGYMGRGAGRWDAWRGGLIRLASSEGGASPKLTQADGVAHIPIELWRARASPGRAGFAWLSACHLLRTRRSRRRALVRSWHGRHLRAPDRSGRGSDGGTMPGDAAASAHGCNFRRRDWAGLLARGVAFAHGSVARACATSRTRRCGWSGRLLACPDRERGR